MNEDQERKRRWLERQHGEVATVVSDHPFYIRREYPTQPDDCLLRFTDVLYVLDARGEIMLMMAR